MITESTDGGNMGGWYLDKKIFSGQGARIIKDDKFVQKVKTEFNKAYKKFIKHTDRLGKEGISEESLAEDFNKLAKYYIIAFAYSYYITGPITYGYGDIVIKKLLNKYRNSPAISQAITKYTVSKENFILDEEKSIRKIGKLIKHSKINKLTQLKNKAPKAYSLLKQHQENYYWIGSNYKQARPLSLAHFFKKALKTEDVPKKVIEKSESDRVVSPSDIKLLKKLGRFASLHDQRKKINIMCNTWLLSFIKVISKQTGHPANLLDYATFTELGDLLDGQKIDVKQLRARTKKYFLLNLPGHEYWLTGQQYKRFEKLINKADLPKQSDKVQGLSANAGKVEGKVRIIYNVSKEGRSFKKGEILVASMTRPEFVPLMKKCSAIVTNEGGITSHAAVISRELNIPCIVGTQNASIVLKNGDRVKVDAVKGIVEKI
ncbi:hypothetical protein KJ782_06715 [Patescibacteria group bacterium]|nr:hypothetical protein [Patescibacteria group bacterium]